LLFSMSFTAINVPVYFMGFTSYNIRVVVFKVPLQELYKNAIL